MKQALGRFACALLDHKWEEQSKIAVETGPRGKGTIIWDVCARCGETRCRWIADFRFGKLDAAQKEVTPSLKITPDICKEVDPYEEVAQPEARAPKAKKATAEAA